MSVNRGSIREFQVEQLVRVLDEPLYKSYKFGLNRSREVVLLSKEHAYLTRTELSLALELGHKLQQALELRHVKIEHVGATTITELRLKRQQYLMDLEEAATRWAGDPGARDAVQA